MNTARRTILGNALVGYDLEQCAVTPPVEEGWRNSSAIEQDAAATLMDLLRAEADRLREAHLVDDASMAQTGSHTQG